MTALSNRALKAIDRRGGAYLALPWPACLRTPAPLPRDEERPATQSQHLAAARSVGPLVTQYGVLHVATQVACLQPPPGYPGAHGAQMFLLAHLVTARWQRITTAGAPAPTLWPPPMRPRRDPHDVDRVADHVGGALLAFGPPPRRRT